MMSTSFLHPCLRRMLSDRGGNFGIMTAIMAPVLLGAAGLAIDYSNMALSQRQLQESTDSAALAAATALASGKVADEAAAKTLAKDFVVGQMTNYAGTASASAIRNATNVDITTSTSSTSKSYSVTVATSYRLGLTPFMNLLGHSTIDISTTSSTTSGTSQTRSALSMELVLDQSGSMGYDTNTCAQYKKNGTTCKTYVVKIDALKQASASLFDALDKADPQHTLVRTGVISYSNGLLRDWTNKVTSVSAMDWGTTKSRDYVTTLSPDGGTDATEPMQLADDTIKKNANSTDAESVAHQKKGNSKVDRFIILMTDGEMTGNSNTWNKDKDQSVRDKCDAAKTDGITLFTVAFMAPDKGKSLLQYCASPGGNYYEAETMEKLVADFESIAQTATKAATLLTN
ncbi:vWA domain-containing protein [Rhizobium leguminosarum]|uniref:Flp pilus assembly protein TadG n=1 Tax=Rhizobium leguminosarum TaxID=384 RepID=A0A7W9ZV50_RHILE|nr:TadE/TadG family type IV pilus assembly protein [Rhizobium leguminosarum]MBB6222144.1 Flp pilus assembly protein TadG [Rhizobium leguminosarum]